MNSRFKFRVWDTKNKNWDSESNEGTYGWDTEGITLNNLIAGIENKGFIIQQFTGSKDKNGREIYEGDILEFHTEGIIFLNGVRSQVFYENGSFIIKFRCNFYELKNHYHHCKIVGNIFENPNCLL